MPVRGKNETPKALPTAAAKGALSAEPQSVAEATTLPLGERVVVALDTEVFDTLGLSFEHPRLALLLTHVRAGEIEFALSDVTKREVEAHIGAWAKEGELAVRQAFNQRKSLRRLKDSGLDAHVALWEASRKAALKQWDEFLERVRADVVTIGDVDPARIFDRYFRSLPPFELSKDKKAEFPDAFAIASLARAAELRGASLFAVSADHGWRDTCGEFPHVRHFETLERLLAALADIPELFREAVEKFVYDAKTQVLPKLRETIAGVELVLDETDGDVLSASVKAMDPISCDVLTRTKDHATVVLKVEALFEAGLRWTEVDEENSYYDSDDHVAFPQRDRMERHEFVVHATALLDVTIRDNQPVTVSKVTLEGDDALYISPSRDSYVMG